MFIGARLKLNRANKHLADLEKIILDLPKFYTSTVEPHSQSGGYTIEHDVPNLEDIKNALALVTGDCIHNLKSTLDFAWFETMSLISPSMADKFTKFPIWNNQKDFERTLKDRKIDVLSPNLFTLLTSDIKPYEAGNYNLWALHKLDIIDKHRLLLPVIQDAAIFGITVENETEEITGNTYSIKTTHPYRVDISPTHQVKNKGKLSLSILFDQGTPFQGREIFSKVILLSKLVFDIVQRLERVS